MNDQIQEKIDEITKLKHEVKQMKQQGERDRDEIANLRLEEKKLERSTSRLKIAEKETTRLNKLLRETKEELKKSKERNAELEKGEETNQETEKTAENDENVTNQEDDQEANDPTKEIKKLKLTIKKKDRTIADLHAQINKAVDNDLQKDKTIRNLNNHLDTYMKISGESRKATDKNSNTKDRLDGRETMEEGKKVRTENEKKENITRLQEKIQQSH
jgi:hypothetical protein